MTKFRSVDEYIGSLPEATQAAVRRVRAAIRKALPHAEETISYNIAAYKVDRRAVVYFAGWKQHYSLYPATPAVRDALGADLAPYNVEKGTIRFPLGSPVPVKMIARIAKVLAGEAAASRQRKRKPVA
jgi:uncharacterized protein YdhG (YjbR/CyaY superfamily)